MTFTLCELVLAYAARISRQDHPQGFSILKVERSLCSFSNPEGQKGLSTLGLGKEQGLKALVQSGF